MDSVGYTSTQQAQPTNEQCTDDERVKPSPQIEPFLQLLPQDAQCRKNLIDRLISEHNTLCGNPGDKIYVTQPTFSASHPKLVEWINTTFSDMSIQGMYFIAFALGGFSEYHELATSVHRGNPGKANTQFIENWFESYGTKASIERLLKLSDTFRKIEKWHILYQNDISRFCSRVTPNTTTSHFEPVTGTEEQSYWAADSYTAASTIFSDLYLDFTDYLPRFNYHIAMEAFDIEGEQRRAMMEQYRESNINNAVMDAIDKFIKTNQQAPGLFAILDSKFQKWAEGGCRRDIVERFNNTLEYR